MRARHRHFNPRDAGATFAFDTRYNKDGHTNNAAVGTWTDRDGDTATQTSTSNPDRRPLWKDNATDNINGHPIIKFDGTNDLLQTASVTSQTEVFGLGVLARNWPSGGTPYKTFLATANYGVNQGIALLTYSGNAFLDWINQSFIAHGDGYNLGKNPRVVSSSLTVYSNNSPRIAAVELSASSVEIWVDGQSIKTGGTTASVPSVTSAIDIGGHINVPGEAVDWSDAKMGMVIYYKDTRPSSALKKRLDHAAAYSFKIACS